MAQAQVAPRVSIEIEVPEDSQAKRNRVSRVVIAGSLVLLTLWFPWWVVHSLIGEAVGHPVTGTFIGLGVGFWWLTLLLPRLLIDNPEWSAYVTLNIFNGKMVPYGPGMHVSFPWEERNEDGNFPLQVITRAFTLTSPTRTSAVTVTGRLFYNASLPFITNAVGVDQEIVEDGLTAFIQSSLLAKLTDMDAEAAIKETARIGKELNDTFRDAPTDDPDGPATPEEFEKKFGYSTAAIVIDKIALSPKVQEALDAVSEAKKMHQIAAGLLGVTPEKLAEMITSKVVTPKQVKELVDRALVTSGNATMKLNVIEGDLKGAVANFLTGDNDGGKS